jgi:hypothetical protein
MRVLLQEGLVKILDGKTPSTSSKEEITEPEKIHNLVLLSLFYGVLSEVANEENAIGL